MLTSRRPPPSGHAMLAIDSCRRLLESEKRRSEQKLNEMQIIHEDHQILSEAFSLET